jgi:hypothetical protein
MPPRGIFERDLQWGVAENKMVETYRGLMRVHDDRLISAALIAEYDFLVRQGKVSMGVAESQVIAPLDPVDSVSSRVIRWGMPGITSSVY